MSSSQRAQQSGGVRLGGYFILVIAFLSSFNWLAILREDYVKEHQWPAASGTVYSIREDSRKVTSPSLRSHEYWVYWVEFFVVLNLPRGQCPGTMMALTRAEEQCTVEVKTPEVKSRANATRWLFRHRPDSQLTVHYDRATGRTWIGGESIFDIYPWDKIALTGIVLLVAVLMIAGAGYLRSGEEEQSGQDISLRQPSTSQH